MKRYVHAAVETYDAVHNYAYAGLRPDTHYAVSILGETIGHMTLSCIERIDGGKVGEEVRADYFLGMKPKQNLNMFGGFAMNIKKLGIDPQDYASDLSLLDAVNDRLMEVVDDPASQALFAYFDIDPLSRTWHTGGSFYQICIPLNSSSEFGPGFKASPDDDYQCFHPDFATVCKMLESNQPIDPEIAVSDTMLKHASQHLAEKEKIRQKAVSAYPYDASDEIVECMHELYKFIVTQKCGGAADLATAEDYIRSKTVDYRRSARYNDSKVADQIELLFDWAADNNMSVTELIRTTRKCYDMLRARWEMSQQ